MTTLAGRSSTRGSLETRIGSRWLLYTGVVALVVGASCFVKLAIDNQWITPAAQVVIATAAGVAFVFAGARFVRARYTLYGQVVEGGGLAVLYVSTYGAFSVYSLIPWPVACTLMVATTVAAASLADVQRSQGLALMAVGGGFATPFLLATNTDPQIPLFTYDAMLVGCTMYLARRRTWPSLCLVSYLSTVLTLTTWAARFYTPDKFLITEIYLALFCVMFLDIVRQGRKTTDPFARLVRVVLCSAPMAFYVASLAILDAHDLLFVCFLGTFSASGAVLTRSAPSSSLRLVLWFAVQEPLFAWIIDHRGDRWLVVGVVSVASIYVVHLLSQMDALARRGWSPSRADRALLHLNALAAAAGTYLLIDAVRPDLAGPVTAVWALWQLGLALAVARRHRSLATHFAALAVTLSTVAIALQFHGLAIVIGWAAEGAVVMWLGLRERNEWLRGSGALLLAMAIVLLTAVQFAPAPVEQLPLFNRRASASLFVTALTYVLAWRHHRRLGTRDKAGDVAVLLVLANALTLTLLTSEITAFCQFRGTSARELALSLTWVTYATALALVGMRKQYAPIRHMAIVVFCLTTVKVFIVDLVELNQLYRVSSVAGLGIALLVTSYLYYRCRANASAD